MAQNLIDLFSALGVRQPEDPPEPVLSSFDVKGIAQYVKDKDVKDVVVMLGAGASVAAGIPDFRSPGTGLYDNLQKYDLPSPQHIFSIDYLEERPEAFFTLARELWPGKYCATTAHVFLKLLHDKNMLRRCYTQNIDGLEGLAGLPSEKYIAAHGNFDNAGCIKCGKEFSPQFVKMHVMDSLVPRCDSCEGVVKPGIVFFGESMPNRFLRGITQDFPACDLLLIIGTSLAVEPFASSCMRVDKAVPRVLINNEQVGLSHGLCFEGEAQYRDVFLGGDLQHNCLQIAEALGFKDELLRLKKKHDSAFLATNAEEHAAEAMHKLKAVEDAPDSTATDTAASASIASSANAVSNATGGAASANVATPTEKVPVSNATDTAASADAESPAKTVSNATDTATSPKVLSPKGEGSEATLSPS